jgi:hypothetical protein
MDSRPAIVFGFFLAAGLLTAPVLFALDQKEMEEGLETGVTVVMKDRYTLESDVHHMPGQVSLNQSDFDVKYEAIAFEKLPVKIWMDYKHLDINEDIPVDLPASLHARRFGVGTILPVPFVQSDEHFMAVDVMPSWYSEDSSFLSSAFRLPFRVYLIYKPQDAHHPFVLIAGAQIDPEADTPATPILGVNYQPNERLNIHLASTEPTITYMLDNHWAIFGEYDASLDEYDVTRGGQKGVVLKVREFAFGGGLKYRIEEWLEASLSGGLNTARRFAYRDDVGKVDVDSAPYIKFRLSMTF